MPDLSPTDEVQVRQKCPVCEGQRFFWADGRPLPPDKEVVMMTYEEFKGLSACAHCTGGYITTWVPLWKLLRTPAPVLEDETSK